MSLPSDVQSLSEMVLRGKSHPAMKMAGHAMTMKRSPNQAFVLLVGLTGAGKSSTINYLFDKKIATTNDIGSQTLSTSEYVVQLKSEEWRIPDLKLSVIDTPGLCDTNGLEQDAKHLSSIKNFLKLHPTLKGNYPNLVMIVLNITDNRIEGECSNFSKMLKGIQKIKVIDPHNPNVVIVLTHAVSIATEVDVWIEKVEKKKIQVQEIVQLFLGITPEIVVQENEPLSFRLEKDGDWFLLPNNEKQPKILYQACASVLDRATDKIGHEAIAVCFRPDAYETIHAGLIIKSSAVEMKDIAEFYTFLCKSVVMSPTSEIACMLENYKPKERDTSLCQDILILQVRFRDLGICNAGDLQTMTLNRLMTKFYPIRINKQMQKVLEGVFGISDEQSAGFDYHVGKGYNIFKDLPTQFSPLVMDEDCIVGLGLPANVDLIKCSSLEIECESIEDANDYVSHRLRELQIDVGANIDFGAFDLHPRFGYNNRKDSTSSLHKSLKMSSFSVERRIQKIKVRKPFLITEEFKADIIALPADYDISKESSILKWKAFFDKWGMYVITGAYMGGSLKGQVKLENEQSDKSSIDNAHAALAMKIAFLQRDASLRSLKKDGDVTLMKELSTIHSTSLKWSGGKSETCKLSLNDIQPDDWKAWVESLEFNPVPLWNSLDLYPLYHLVSEVSREKGLKMQMAMNLAVSGLFIHTPSKEDNRTNTAISNDSGNCFHEDTIVMLPNRKIKLMKDLSVGDKILNVDNNGVLVKDRVIAWLHRVTNGQYTFLQIVHDQGKLTLTPEHIIFVGKSRNPQHASTLRPGDELSFFVNYGDHHTVTMAIVLSIHEVEGRGVYAPMTYNGRLLVDNVDVSCYCTINPLKVLGKDIISSHALAHAGFLPLRVAFKFGLNISTTQLDDESGIHSYARWLMKIILG